MAPVDVAVVPFGVCKPEGSGCKQREGKMINKRTINSGKADYSTIQDKKEAISSDANINGIKSSARL